MSVEQMAIVLHHSKMSGSAKVVMLGIANHDGDGGAFPAMSTLEKYTNLKTRAVQSAISLCVAAGELRVEPRWMPGPDGRPTNLTNRYHVLVSCPATCDRSRQHRDVSAGKTGETQRTTPGVVDDTPPGAKFCTPLVQETTPKPSLNHPSEQETPTESLRATRSRNGTRIPDTFMPTTALTEWARREAPNAGMRDHEQFMDYWRSKPGAAGRKVDWPATWRNWMRKASDGRTAKPSTTDERVQAVRALRPAAEAADARAEAIEGHRALFAIGES